MKKSLFILMAVIGLFSCKKAPEAVSVPFEKFENHFAIVEGPKTLKITDQETFERTFNPGYTMGTQQEPLDFGKEFVIAVINPLTDERTTLAPVSLIQENDKLVFTYSEQIGEKMTSTSTPTLIIRVDKQYEAPVEFIKVQK